jgi:hypothetical protein
MTTADFDYPQKRQNTFAVLKGLDLAIGSMIL